MYVASYNICSSYVLFKFLLIFNNCIHKSIYVYSYRCIDYCELIFSVLKLWISIKFTTKLLYRIVENFGGGKLWRIWRINVEFAKVLPSKFLIVGTCTKSGNRARNRVT